MNKLWGYVIASLFGALSTGVVGGFVVGNRLVAIETQLTAHGNQIADLASGRTTPMADSTRERFSAMEKQVEQIWNELRSQRDRYERRFGNGGSSTAPLLPKGG